MKSIREMFWGFVSNKENDEMEVFSKIKCKFVQKHISVYIETIPFRFNGINTAQKKYTLVDR